ncbi:MAG: NAD(P)H-dependent oxidoreductase, partial [Desulfobacterales bacterium]|nr:NAD(P)H-dependent oxidoreductase [Desulfobacterales bacterium]
MQILILYFSKGGNTKKLAEAIARGVEAVEGVDTVLRRTDEVTKDDFLASDGVIAGSPVYFGVMAAELKRIFDEFVGVRKKMEGKVGATFATSGDPTGGKETTMMSIIQALLIYGMVIVGDPMSATGHYGV